MNVRMCIVFMSLYIMCVDVYTCVHTMYVKINTNY